MVTVIVNAMTLLLIVHSSAYTRRQRLFPSTSLTGGIEIGRINERFLKLTETILVNERQHCFDKSSTIMRISGHNDKDDYGNANTDRR
jgi:hypothetical protein